MDHDIRELKERFKRKLVERSPHSGTPEQVREHVNASVEQLLKEERRILPRRAVASLIDQLADEITGLGPIERLLRDQSVTEVMVNGPGQIYIERAGGVQPTDVRFESDRHLMHTIERIVAPLGLRIDESSPMVDGRLPDGSRVNAIIPPVSLTGPVLTIRRFSATPFTMEELVDLGTLSSEISLYLKHAVEAKANILISGGTGSGKTSFLNTLSGLIPPDQRLITIEDAAELRLPQPHVVSLESRPPNIEGKGQVTIRELVRNALRMRPDRVIVGEVRGGEALDMLQAMNTGHEGSLTTAHANAPTDALRRIETMVLMADVNLPIAPVREQIASAIDLIVHMARFADGRRRVVHVAALRGLTQGCYEMHSQFRFETADQPGGETNGAFLAVGELVPARLLRRKMSA